MSHNERAAPLRVLVVDDEPGTRALLAEILETQGYEVLAGASGAEGLARLREAGGADLLVLDISLPDMDGPEIAVCAAEAHGVRPTIFVTGWVDEFYQLGHVPGRWVLLQKPVQIPKLLECIGTLGVGASAREPQV